MPSEQYLFALVPLNSGARQVGRANRRYRRSIDGAESLCFEAEHKSKFAGRLLSIGHLAPMNDVVLVDEGAQ